MDRTYFGGCELRAHLAEESMFAKDNRIFACLSGQMG